MCGAGGRIARGSIATDALMLGFTSEKGPHVADIASKYEGMVGTNAYACVKRDTWTLRTYFKTWLNESNNCDEERRETGNEIVSHGGQGEKNRQ